MICVHVWLALCVWLCGCGGGTCPFIFPCSMYCVCAVPLFLVMPELSGSIRHPWDVESTLWTVCQAAAPKRLQHTDTASCKLSCTQVSAGISFVYTLCYNMLLALCCHMSTPGEWRSPGLCSLSCLWWLSHHSVHSYIAATVVAESSDTLQSSQWQQSCGGSP